jgi:hypothetical protein
LVRWKWDAKDFFAEEDSRVFEDPAFGEVVSELDSFPYMREVFGRCGVNTGK